MKVRVIVTTKCRRNDKGFAPTGIPVVGLEELLKYDEISIVGGEPMVISERVVELVHRLRLRGYKGKIWLYTANTHRLGRYWAVSMLIDEVDGITYIVDDSKDFDKVKSDFVDLRRLDKYLKESDRIGKSDRLYIDSRVYKTEYVKSLEYKWAEIKPFKSEEKYSPEGEDHVFYDLESEG